MSDAQALDPLFTAPLSETREEYGYRLTAMSAGFYRTATVAVSVGGFVREGQEAFQAPAEECGSFGGSGRDQEGCQPWEKAPSPDSFGDVPEEEGIVPWPSFPEAPGAEDKEFAGSSGAGPFPQAPPRLECPVAVFLEELETGAIECRAWDASGEEYLEYSWEPVGSTTRDYLENPRLMPEDSPNPSVVAPEAPAYETLESFRSVEPTFRYRYRLTATSRATGLSSSSEVEVFVSSSRPGVYCPLEVAVEEGETIALDCEGWIRCRLAWTTTRTARRSHGSGRVFGARARRFWMRRTGRLLCYGSCRERGRGVPLHSEHDIFFFGSSSHGAQKSDSQGRGRRRRFGTYGCPLH